MRVTKMANSITSHPLVGTVPRGPRPVYPQTPETIASARAFYASERARLEALGIILSDPDGTRARLDLALGGEL
jgi:hypothetical protein